MSTTITPELRADVLVEAIPYLARFAGSRIVVKYGGNALADADEEQEPRHEQEVVGAAQDVLDAECDKACGCVVPASVDGSGAADGAAVPERITPVWAPAAATETTRRESTRPVTRIPRLLSQVLRAGGVSRRLAEAANASGCRRIVVSDS